MAERLSHILLVSSLLSFAASHGFAAQPVENRDDALGAAEATVDVNEAPSVSASRSESGLIIEAKKSTVSSGPRALDIEPTMAAQEDEKALPPWAGTSISYRNAVSLPTFFKDYFAYEHSLDPSQCGGGPCGRYNPYYAMSLGLSPAWALTDDVSLLASLTMTTELTQSDAYPSGYPVQLSDVVVSGRYANLYEIPAIDVDVAALASISAGTSLVSQAAGKLGSTGLALEFNRRFSVLNGLTLSMDVGATGNLYSRGGGAVSQGLLRACTAGLTEAPTGECQDVLLGNGVRNVALKINHGYAASLQMLDWLGLAANVGFGWGFLDGLDANSLDHRATQNSTNTRYYVSSGLSLRAKIPQMPYMTVVLGESMAHGQLGVDGQYISLGRMIDRMTFYLDLRFNLGSLVAEL